MSPLFLALFGEDPPALRAALANGSSVDETDWARRTPLHWACQARSYELIRVLVDAGASLSLRDVQGHSPLDLLLSERFGRCDPIDDIDPMRWGPDAERWLQ